jgi:hypothetical protein
LNIGGFEYLIVAYFSKTLTDQMEYINISSLNINMRLNHGLSFFGHGTHFVLSKTHAMEVSQAVFTWNILSK